MSIRKIPVIKGGTGAFVEIESDSIPSEIYAHALDTGLKTLVNGGATKITIAKEESDPEKIAAYHAAAKAKADERVQAILTGTLKLGKGAGATKGPAGAVLIEARRIARDYIKQALKDHNLKVSHYSASEITTKANELLASDSGPGLIKIAEENLATRGKSAIVVDVTSLKEDPALVAKDEEKTLARKAGTLSKTQAGKVAPRVSKTLN
jgi:hypothetical protein